MKYALGFFIIIVLMFSCRFSTIYENRLKDRDAAKSVVDSLLYLKANRLFDQTYEFFSPMFFEKIDTVQLRNIFSLSDSTMGVIESYSLSDWETKVDEGGVKRGDYMLVYQIKRAHANTVETYLLRSNNDGLIKIVSFKINR